MRTPKEYTDNLKKNIITEEMLAVSLYSVNKRAKNYRDKERSYRQYRRYDTYNNEEKNREKKEEYYKIKEKLLSVLIPTCIHKEEHRRKRRYYEYECDLDSFLPEQIVNQNEYYDRELREYVQFVDVYETVYNHYLYYKIGDYSFHTPINDDDELRILLKLHDVEEVSTIVTSGKAITDLISMNFVKKLLEVIESGEYQLIE